MRSSFLLLSLSLTALCYSCHHKCTCTYIDPDSGLQQSEVAWIEGGAGVTKSSSTARCNMTELEYKQLYDDANCVTTK